VSRLRRFRREILLLLGLCMTGCLDEIVTGPAVYGPVWIVLFGVLMVTFIVIALVFE
jgi:hypothetical protein